MIETPTLADALSEGIIKQFREKFGGARKIGDVVETYLAAINERDAATRRKLWKRPSPRASPSRASCSRREGREASNQLTEQSVTERPEADAPVVDRSGI